MPSPFPHPHLEVAREFIPFREVGGDYYDLVPLRGGRLAFAIGDHRDAFVRLHVEADANRVARARGEFLVKGRQQGV